MLKQVIKSGDEEYENHVSLLNNNTKNKEMKKKTGLKRQRRGIVEDDDVTQADQLPADLVFVSDLDSFKTGVSKINHVHP